MKKITFIFFLINSVGFSQIGINTETPSSAAVLHLEASNFGTTTMGGYLMPVVTEAQRDDIPVTTTSDADDGLQLFLNDPITGKKCWQVYDSFAQLWRDIYCTEGGTMPVCASNPIVLYQEDFESYAEDTGVTGASSSNGDYPSGVSKWTLTSFTAFGSNTPALPGTLSNADDYGLVQNGELVFRDTNGTFRFETQAIDISGYSDILISMDIREEGPMDYAGESSGSGGPDHIDDFSCGETISDYLDIEYSTDGGSSYTEIPNYTTYGNSDHTFNNNLPVGVVNFSASGISGTSLIVRVRLQNWASNEYWFLDNIRVTCN
ncbi:hypothetical protein ACFQO1_05610 [Jejudonia soesokkakensis]|uniref:Uncharacterized protein n=1 Tax=Jejudonia soesokkakensis TaxID=1323432 RepID=A0ABW2MUE4_9FLAO